MKTYPTRYNDRFGEEQTTVLDHGDSLTMVVRGVRFRGRDFDGFEPDAIGSADRSAVDASLERLIAVRHGDEKTHSGVWRDMAVRKRRTEVDAHFGPIVVDAQRLRLEVPLLQRMIAMIHEVEDGRRSFSGANLDELERSLPA